MSCNEVQLEQNDPIQIWTKKKWEEKIQKILYLFALFSTVSSLHPIFALSSLSLSLPFIRVSLSLQICV